MIIFFGWMPKIYSFQLPKLNKYCLGVELALAHRVIEKPKMDHLWVYKLYHAATVTESHRQKVRTKIFVLIIWTCFLYGLSRCQIRHEYGLNVTIHKHDRIYSQKDTAKRKYRQLFWNVFKMQEITSRMRGFAWNLDDFSRRYWKANMGKFRRGVHTEIYGVFKVKNRKTFQSGSAKCHWTWKYASLTRRTDAKWLYPTNLDANSNTLTGLSFGVLSPTGIQILYD